MGKKCNFYLRTFDQNAKKFDSVGKIDIFLLRFFPSFLRLESERTLVLYIQNIKLNKASQKNTSEKWFDEVMWSIFFLLIPAGRFWSCTCKVSSYQNLLERSGNFVVPTARCPAWLDRVLHAHRHVGRGLHFLRNGLRTSSFPWFYRWGRVAPDIQGKLAWIIFIKHIKGTQVGH